MSLRQKEKEKESQGECSSYRETKREGKEDRMYVRQRDKNRKTSDRMYARQREKENKRDL